MSGDSQKNEGKSGSRHRILSNLLSLFVGVLVGALVHYLIYRVALPAEPFIYVAF